MLVRCTLIVDCTACQFEIIRLKGEIYMDGYKIVYKEPDGTITDTFFGEPELNFCLTNLSNMDVVMMFFDYAHPGCEIVSIERCSFEEFSK